MDLEAKTLGAVASPMAKPSIGKVNFVKANEMMTMMLNNMNIQISILEINRESIIILLNQLLYLFSKHPTSMYVM